MLPPDATQRAESFRRLSDERKQSILAHLTSIPKPDEAINQILANGGEDAEFLVHILAKETPERRESPDNKQFDSIHTK